MCIHKIGIETACRVTETVQLLGDLPPDSIFGDCSLAGHQMLYPWTVPVSSVTKLSDSALQPEKG